MSDTIITVIAIFIAAILMFIFPVLNVAVENDKTVQTVVETLVTDYTNIISKTGKITLKDYDNFIIKLYATGNTYDVKIEAKILDENLNKLDNEVSPQYYSVFTESIFNSMEEENREEYYLKQGDLIVVTAQNTNITIGTQLKNLLYKVSGKERNEIYVSCTLPVTENGINSVNIAGAFSDGEYLINIKSKRPMGASTRYKPYNLILCLDSSVSMENNSETIGSELEAARNHAINIIENENLEKNTVTVVAFSDIALEVVNSIDVNNIEEIKTKVNSNSTYLLTRTLGGSTNYDALMGKLRNIADKLENNGKVTIVIILTDGMNSYAIRNPESSIADKIPLENIFSIIYNLEGNLEFIGNFYVGKEHLAVKSHPKITMGMFSGQVDYNKLYYNNQSDFDPDYFQNKINNADTEISNCKVATESLDFSHLIKEIVEEVEDSDEFILQPQPTVNKKLVLNTEDIDLDKEVKIIIGDAEEAKFTIADLPDNVIHDATNKTLTIDFSIYDIPDDLSDSIWVEYYF